MTNILSDLAEILLSVYALAKHPFRGRTIPDSSSPLPFLYELLYILATLITFAIVAPVTIILVIFRQILGAYLRVKYGKQYIGLLRGMDAIWTAESIEAKHLINCILFIQIGKSPQDFLASLQERFKSTKDTRFNSTLHGLLGYHYRIHSDDIVYKALRLITLTPNEALIKEAFEERISNFANTPLRDRSSYELLLSDKPVKFYDTENGGNQTYVAIFRIHHSVGDGPSLMKFLLKLANENANSNLVKSSINYPENTGMQKRHVISSKKLSTNYYDYALKVMNSMSVSWFAMNEPQDHNILHGPPLSGNKILAYHIERRREYISKIKSIKSRYEDCKFSDITYTAISASLYEYFAQHTSNVPRDIHMLFITRIKDRMAALCFEIPLQIDGTTSASEKLSQRLNIIKARRMIVDRSLDALVFYWLSEFTSLLPTFAARKLCESNMKATISLSNVLGGELVNLVGQPVKDIVFWTPNVSKTGVGFSAFTYDGRLQMGLIADKALISQTEDVTAILRNVPKYIDLLDAN